MQKQDLRIPSKGGSEFDCYLVTPAPAAKWPAVVLASAIHGVDQDLRDIADTLAARGAIVAAPDLFWRTEPGAVARGDARARTRAEPRLEKLHTGEQDLADTLAYLRGLPGCNGRAAVMGFCYGGPYAILGPSRLGYDAGMACHGSQMLDFLADVKGVRCPVCVLWGDRDHLAPSPVIDAYRALAARSGKLHVQVLAGVRHGYMMRSNAEAFDRHAYESSMERAYAMLDSLRDQPVR